MTDRRPLSCLMQSHSTSRGLSQVYTGFALLNAAGRIRLRQHVVPSENLDLTQPQHLRDAQKDHLLVELDGGRRVFYDTHDSPEIDPVALNQVDIYFKRSFSPDVVPAGQAGRVLPLGLNYALYLGGFDRFEFQRELAFRRGLRAKARLLARTAWRRGAMDAATEHFRPTVANMYAPPDPEGEPRVLFMVRAWDPLDVPDRSPIHREQRAEINETRARCVMLLRKEFGSRFTGGFRHDDYAQQHYRQVLIADARQAFKANYLKLLASHPICVATTGLHGSIGWKFGEYVAFSKAILSEPLRYQVPGNLAEGGNYLVFRTPEECVERAVTLFEDAGLRGSMMQANHQYFQRYLRPDRLVLRTLEVTVGGGEFKA
jgi:hypothetical protein